MNKKLNCNINCSSTNQEEPRQGAILILSAIMIIVVFAFVAFTVDMGYLAVMKTGLQSTADSAALGAVLELGIGQPEARQMAKDLGSENYVGGDPVTLLDADIQIGVYDQVAKTFVVSGSSANAVKVIAKKYDHPTFFGSVLGQHKMSAQAEAIAIMSPRDIVFVVDLSGSMNDDTEPCWATEGINAKFGPAGYPTAGSDLASTLFSDFNFGAYPGTHEYIGAPLGVTSDYWAYAEMTKDNGPMTSIAIIGKYRIKNTDTEAERKKKAYSWMIDKQIAVQMPNALPAPNSNTNYDYWEKYLDYLIAHAYPGVDPPPPPPGPPGPPPPPPPPPGPPGPPPPPSPPIGMYNPLEPVDGSTRVSVAHSAMETGTQWWKSLSSIRPSHFFSMQVASPAGIGTPRNGSTAVIHVPSPQDSNRIYHFNNPNRLTYPGVYVYAAHGWRNKIGYITYVQYMLDWGRDRSPEEDDSTNANEALPGKTPLSVLSPHCPYHDEVTAGGTFSFPPRTQPMHSVRRSLIAAIQVVKEMNAGLTVGSGDRISIVTYDGYDTYHQPKLKLALTGDYDAAMLACTKLQATSDIGTTTAMETGMVLARDHIKPISKGGQGREFTSKVVVLLTDGVPNAYQTVNSDIDDYMTNNPSANFYGGGYYWLDAALMQAAEFNSSDKGDLYPVGMGGGTDYDFMDRLARTSGTDKSGQSPRGSGNPTQYEQRLIDIFEEIIKRPDSRLVE